MDFAPSTNWGLELCSQDSYDALCLRQSSPPTTPENLLPSFSMANLEELIKTALQKPDLRKSVKGILEQALEQLANPSLPEDELKRLLEQAEKLAKESVA